MLQLGQLQSKKGYKKESKKGCNGKSSKCITHYLWDELELYINDFFNKKNLGDLLKKNLESRTET